MKIRDVAVRAGITSVSRLADLLDCPPARARRLLQEHAPAGYSDRYAGEIDWLARRYGVSYTRLLNLLIEGLRNPSPR